MPLSDFKIGKSKNGNHVGHLGLYARDANKIKKHYLRKSNACSARSLCHLSSHARSEPELATFPSSEWQIQVQIMHVRDDRENAQDEIVLFVLECVA